MPHIAGGVPAAAAAAGGDGVADAAAGCVLALDVAAEASAFVVCAFAAPRAEVGPQPRQTWAPWMARPRGATLPPHAQAPARCIPAAALKPLQELQALAAAAPHGALPAGAHACGSARTSAGIKGARFCVQRLGFNQLPGQSCCQPWHGTNADEPQACAGFGEQQALLARRIHTRSTPHNLHGPCQRPADVRPRRRRSALPCVSWQHAVRSGLRSAAPSAAPRAGRCREAASLCQEAARHSHEPKGCCQEAACCSWN
eukprot:24106-Chlamydomonas_euryale.AAC.9